MNNDSAQPAGTAQQPLVQPQKAELTPEQKAKNKKSGIIGGVVAIVLLIVLIVGSIISKSSAEKAVNEVTEICSEKGLYSTECKDAQQKKKVTCDSLTGYCSKEYFTLF